MLVCLAGAGAAEASRNFFANPGFEMGRDGWAASKAGKTEVQFTVGKEDAAEGQHSALLTIGSVESWGLQFGQSFAAGIKGRTYTFAAFARSLKGPVAVRLEIERSANPWDRATTGPRFELTEKWQELHTTFVLEKDFPQGWFAYLSCNQPQASFRVDMVRLYEGPYVPFQETVRQETMAAGVRLYDVGRNSAQRLPGEALARKAGWTEIPEDDLTHRFKGDAVLMNNCLAAVLRRGAGGVELYSLGPTGPAMQTVLAPLSDAGEGALSSVVTVENSPGGAALDVTFKTAGGKDLTVRYDLKPGQPFVQTQARNGVKGLRVLAPCRFVVMPDFFADDIVIDAAELPVAKAELPSDNFLVHLLPDRQAMVMTVSKSSEQDIRVTLGGEGAQRLITSSELCYEKDGPIWVGLMTAPAIWHLQEITQEQAGNIVRTDWRAPFPALWRVDWRRQENLTDSWEMLVERRDGAFAKHSLYGGPETVPTNRRRWTTVLGTFEYPCWVDQEGQAFLQPFKGRALQFVGPAVIYPVGRVPATALDTFTVVDLVRNTLGVGPCEYILDIEGQQSSYRGRATCSVRDTLNPIYAAHQQKQRRAEIEKVLEDLMIFIRHIRGRIEGYVAFAHQTMDYLGQQKQAHPELADRLAELEKLAQVIDTRLAARRQSIKTPEEAAAMVKEFRETVLDYEGEDALARCKRFTGAWVDIGGNQDELAGECRWAVKMIRQKAGLLMAADPRLAEVGTELRRRTQVILRHPAGHEGARH